MRKIIRLPIKTALRGTIAQYAKALPKPHKNLVTEPVIETRSKLFDPEIVQVPKRRKEKRGHVIEAGALNIPMPPKARGEKNRPDLSTPKTSLTFKWSAA